MGEVRIGVIGAGSIGTWLGGRLTASGHDVVMVGRERLAREIATAGLTIADMDGSRHAVAPEAVRYGVEPEALADRDVVLCCVKSAQTREVAETLAKTLATPRVVVSLQNGVGNADVLRAGLPSHVVLGGIVGFNVISQGGGRFRRATTGHLVIEASADSRARALVRALIDAGTTVETPADVRPLQWSKLVMNVANCVSALSGAPTRDILYLTGYRRVVRALMKEAIGVIRAAGMPMARLGPLPPRVFPWVLALPSPLFRVAARAQLAVDPEARSSMWEDLDKRRLTEVDYLNGEIVALAQRHGLAAPVNARVVELVHRVEAERAGSPKMSAEALWRALAAG
ncbi:MAG: 2-dehydropantoate 2-reductase [Myxococcales bacterium]|jgi:2-dehydropantoate 2-reductase|nr:2-dehydropantoate 2-reductase [Myxococcales bacterium]